MFKMLTIGITIGLKNSITLINVQSLITSRVTNCIHVSVTNFIFCYQILILGQLVITFESKHIKSYPDNIMLDSFGRRGIAF